MDNNTLLSVKDLRVWFELKRWGFLSAGFVRAVDGVNFELSKGQAITIVGESGSGKTSLLRTILGLTEPTGGEIVFAGRQIDWRKSSEVTWLRWQIGFVQQDPYGALPPFMNVERILREPLIINKVKPEEQRQRIREALEEVRLIPVDDFLTKFPHMLSGGQQQRLVVARALILRPMLIVADEPVSMLDASVRVEILELMRKIQRDYHLGVIYITHDLSSVRYFSERVFIMYAAKLVEKADVDDIVQNPLHPYAQALLNAIPDPEPENVAKFRDVPPGEPPNLIHPPPGCRFHPRCPHMMEGLCDEQEPPAFEPNPGHLVECWLYDPQGSHERSTTVFQTMADAKLARQEEQSAKDASQYDKP
ncbi:MAG: ABC transporter ATP-binding protein [Dehalococcoidia bacterium]|nr:ABC transporter ATP-binding protein [Dehalococcoidia bacterium]